MAAVPHTLAHPLLLAIVAAGIALMLLRPRGIAETYWISGAAILLLALRLIPLRLAGHAIAKGSDVYLFLSGMMLLSELAREHGVFEWVAGFALGHARGSRQRLFLLVYVAGAAVTVCMSNDATAVVLTPAILNAVTKADMPPLPCLFVCAMVANAASFVLPISNPANLVVYQQHMPALPNWLASFALASALSIVVTYVALRWYFRADLRGTIRGAVQSTKLEANGRLVLAGLAMVIAVLLTASALRWSLGLPTCLAALLITAVVSLRARTNPLLLAKRISWKTLVLVAGLFILVSAVESVGALRISSAALRYTEQLAPPASAFLTSFTVGIANNLVNNLPLGLIAGAAVQSMHVQGLLAHAVLIGVDLGPNLSITGSLATILWLLALRKEGLHVSFWDFLKVGAVAMPAAMLAATAGALLTRA